MENQEETELIKMLIIINKHLDSQKLGSAEKAIEAYERIQEKRIEIMTLSKGKRKC